MTLIVQAQNHSTSGDNIGPSSTPDVGESLELVEENDIRENSRKAVYLSGAAPNT